MFTSLDKALAALIMAVVFLINNFTEFHFAVTPEVVNGIVGVLTPLAVYFIPNKA